MKYLLFLTICVFSGVLSDLIAQSSFKLTIQTTYDERPLDALELLNGDFLVIGPSNEGLYSQTFSKIYKISSQGTLVNVIELINPDGDCILANIVSIPQDNFG